MSNFFADRDAARADQMRGTVEKQIADLRAEVERLRAKLAVYKNATEIFNDMACKWASKHGTEKELREFTDASNAVNSFLRDERRRAAEALKQEGR